MASDILTTGSVARSLYDILQEIPPKGQIPLWDILLPHEQDLLLDIWHCIRLPHMEGEHMVWHREVLDHSHFLPRIKRCRPELAAIVWFTCPTSLSNRWVKRQIHGMNNNVWRLPTEGALDYTVRNTPPILAKETWIEPWSQFFQGVCGLLMCMGYPEDEAFSLADTHLEMGKIRSAWDLRIREAIGLKPRTIAVWMLKNPDADLPLRAGFRGWLRDFVSRDPRLYALAISINPKKWADVKEKFDLFDLF